MKRSRLKLLNVGCGRHFHADWQNVDVVSFDPAVKQHDLRQGLPGLNDEIEMVYHSHVLEHLPEEQGKRLLAECYRVLKPGGVLRVAVPDLEQIAKMYLETLQEAECGGEAEYQRYHWMKLELIDQMTRHQSGGDMGPFMRDCPAPFEPFLQQRLGHEVSYAQDVDAKADPNVDRNTGDHNLAGNAEARNSKPPTAKSERIPWRQRWARRLVRWLLGKQAVSWLDIGQFRDSGEVHRWMYDRISLRQVCQSLGFADFKVCQADESYLANYAKFQLDSVDGRVRKPDSLFVECRKPMPVATQTKLDAA